MRRLQIGWIGTSKALQTVRQWVEQYGHGTAHELDDLVIEDASLALPAHLIQVPRISLRLGVGPLTEHGLPALQLRAYDHQQRLLATLEAPEEPSGNGQCLRQQATDTLAQWAALHISGFARDRGYLPHEACANSWPEQGLLGLDAVAFLHRLNRTADRTCCKPPKYP